MVSSQKDDKKKAKKFYISSPADWSLAYSLYSSMMVHFKLEKALQLAVCASIIVGLARDTRNPQIWIQYDRLFHQAVAVDPVLEWHRQLHQTLLSPLHLGTHLKLGKLSQLQQALQCTLWTRHAGLLIAAYTSSPKPTACTDMFATSVWVLQYRCPVMALHLMMQSGITRSVHVIPSLYSLPYSDHPSDHSLTVLTVYGIAP